MAMALRGKRMVGMRRVCRWHSRPNFLNACRSIVSIVSIVSIPYHTIPYHTIPYLKEHGDQVDEVEAGQYSEELGQGSVGPNTRNTAKYCLASTNQNNRIGGKLADSLKNALVNRNVCQYSLSGADTEVFHIYPQMRNQLHGF